MATQAGFYTMIGAVATREFIKNKLYRPIYQKAHALKVDEFRIVEPMPCGKLAAPQKETLLTQEMTDELRQFHRESNQKAIRPKVCSFNQIESPELFGCGGGTQHLFIDPSGEVTPCDFTPLSFGNVTQETLEMIWKRMNHAMGDAPRRYCFIQKNHQRIAEHTNGHSFPLPPDTSALICSQAGEEDLPDYFKLVAACSKTPTCGEPPVLS
jgi:MoaA/NifB/PqqE/SkfB family radical SAM enzyme